ncbi:caspase family protein [Scytonema sp. UIC 10036]|uniref:caspase family protein n=1 Tax=Scytonema sp. UIC 10036 TaxID=2304196 RepID=UPI0012DA5AB7|nr:caspase family protein [Scytonema sp. UIC 10036]MUG96092.1 caspase family protein [Scytonema sp. UIC 10036]
MSRSIYALAVGIDNYKSPTIPPLEGCINDIIAIEEFLRKQVTNNGDRLYIKKLLNYQATRQAIITAFREHLCQAKSNDIALFYYSGHGSQEDAAKEFWHLEPDHLNETLVCWDSRTEDNWDLADKELAKLIAEVSQNNPHIVVILDCCHSGGGTRDRNNVTYTGIRSVENDWRKRPLSSFIFSDEEINGLLSGSFSLPKGEYIFLAACRDNEEAREHFSQKRGAFSYFLLDSLQRNSHLTYRDIFKRTNAFVRSFYPQQSPQIEATNSNYLDQPFLGGTIVKRQMYFTVIYDRVYGWSIDGGAVHGIISGQGKEKTRLAIFPIDVEDISQLQNAVAVAEVTEVLPQLSRINISGEKKELKPEFTYKAVIISQALSSLKVYLEGEEPGINFARQAIHTASFGESPSLYICEVSDFSDADFHLQASHDEYLLIRASDRRQLISPISGFTLESAQQAIQALEHIARWITIATITSPANSSIQSDAMLMQVYQQSSEIQDYQIYLEYKVNDDKIQPPSIQIKLTNKSHKILYCVLLNLTERFAVTAIPFAGDCTGIWLEPGQETWALEGKHISISIPQNLWKPGVMEYKDILKLIVSTTEFDAKLLEQDNLEILHTRSSNTVNTQLHLTLDNSVKRLISQVQSRAIVAEPSEPQKPEILDDWVTNEILIITAIPKEVNLQKPDGEKLTQKQNSQIERDTTYKNDTLVGSSWFKQIRIGLILMVTFTAILGCLLSWQKSHQDKSNGHRVSSYIFYHVGEKPNVL